MELKYTINDNIAPLSWIAVVKDDCVSVCCGRHVEHNKEFFCEGAWDGSYKDGLFPYAEWFCGTGGLIEEKRVCFSTPTHVTSALYTKNRGGGIGYPTVFVFYWQ